LSAGYRFAINEKFGAYSESNDNGINSADDTSIVILNNDTYQSSFEVDAESVGAEVLIMNPGQSIAVPYSFSIHKWDLAAQAGLRYYPIPRLGIDLSYQHGLLNMTKNTDTNRNSGLQLALVWQLHR